MNSIAHFVEYGNMQIVNFLLIVVNCVKIGHFEEIGDEPHRLYMPVRGLLYSFCRIIGMPCCAKREKINCLGACLEKVIYYEKQNESMPEK